MESEGSTGGFRHRIVWGALSVVAFAAGCGAGSGMSDEAVPAMVAEAAASPAPAEVCTEISDAAADVLMRFMGVAAGNAEDIEATIAAVGLDVDALVENGGMGGPFLPPGEDNAEPTSLSSLMLHVDRWEELRKLMHALPLGAPLDRYAVSSRFGPRQDPIDQKGARHAGIDLIAPSKTPVYATAAGTVVEAGVQGSLGKMVEIDHGMGVRTRYGHLHSILVKTGDEVQDGQQVGRVGSTGRSTGPHLHYEIMVGSTLRDPLDFIRAGKRFTE